MLLIPIQVLGRSDIAKRLLDVGIAGQKIIWYSLWQGQAFTWRIADLIIVWY